MKRIGNLFERVVDRDNLRLAFLKASRGKRHRDDQRRFEANLEVELTRLREGLLAGDYPVGDYRRFTIFDPKEREICAASFGERVLQHALMNVCEPYFDRWMVAQTFASRTGMGQTAAVTQARACAARHAWFLKADFRKYFDSIPHIGIQRLLARRFKDRAVLDWFFRILAAYEKTPGRGLPIGNLTSQFFANLYLDALDREVLGRGFAYVRYMDDFVAWSDDRRRLVELRAELTAFARDVLDLAFKQVPYVNRTRHGMDFLGMRIFPQSVRLSRASKLRYSRTVRAYEWRFAHGRMGERELQDRLTALTAFTLQAEAAAWRRRQMAARKELRATTASTAAAAGTTTPRTAAPRTATGTTPATATTTWASASLAPQHRRNESLAVPAGGQLPKGTKTTDATALVGMADAVAERSGASPFPECVIEEVET